MTHHMEKYAGGTAENHTGLVRVCADTCWAELKTTNVNKVSVALLLRKDFEKP